MAGETEELQSQNQRGERSSWRKFVGEADEESIWKLKKYLDTTPTSTYIPTLDGTAASNEQKLKLLQSKFFPQPPYADLSNIQNATYPISVPSLPQITASQLGTAIEKVSPKKAPGPDEILNLVIKKCFDELKDHLLLLAQQSFKTAHFPTIFKESTTLVL